MMSADARILDRGYRRYAGERRGAAGARLALYSHSLRRALGLRRGARHKIVPFGTIALCYLPAIAFVGIAALVPKNIASDIAPRYGAYYGYISAVILLFVASIVPDLMCTDRRSGMLGLYLAAPLDRKSYLAIKAMSIATILAVVTLGPPVLLLIGYSFLEIGPSWPLSGLGVLLRITGGGLVLAAWYTGLGMAVASLTDRRAWAAAGTTLSTLVSSTIVGVLIGNIEGPGWLVSLDLFNLPFELSRRIYRETAQYNVSTAVVAAATIGWLCAAAATIGLRYRRLRVTR